ncbi:unnamed protein product [Rotaria socialis]|uniref:DOMON domain-containing protein n=2 Tax=Rotaria socialis TaxID=392032 RepID=A0A818FG87_9BILA|nr:unnamed protein product [Rotaria socialis]
MDEYGCKSNVENSENAYGIYLTTNAMYALTSIAHRGTSNITIGSFTISWRYNNTSNTVQFVIQGQASSNINLASTYIAMGWSDTVPTGNTMDVAMFFPGTQIVQDRYSRGYATIY